MFKSDYSTIDEFHQNEFRYEKFDFITIIKDIFTSKNRRVNRIFNRSKLFNQSTGEVNIHRKLDNSISRSLYGNDWFHTLVNSSTYKCIGILLALYVLLIFTFSCPFYLIATYCDCGLDMETYYESFIFTLEAITSTNYATKDAYFNNCFVVVFTLLMMTSVKLVSDSITIGIIYARIARPNSRASTIIFSNHAIIRRINGKLYFMLQVCELRKHQLVEAHIRCYTIKNEAKSSGNNTVFQTCSMHMNHPNDTTGGMILLLLPQIIIHEINESSPLMPPNLKSGEVNNPSDFDGGEIKFPQQGTNEISCSSNIFKQKINTARSPSSRSRSYSFKVEEYENIFNFLTESKAEICVIVEGSDCGTGGVVQARHSYTIDNIKFNRFFAPCVYEDPEDGFATIDFNRFHDLIEIDENSEYVDTFQSHS